MTRATRQRQTHVERISADSDRASTEHTPDKRDRCFQTPSPCLAAAQSALAAHSPTAQRRHSLQLTAMSGVVGPSTRRAQGSAQKAPPTHNTAAPTPAPAAASSRPSTSSSSLTVQQQKEQNLRRNVIATRPPAPPTAAAAVAAASSTAPLPAPTPGMANAPSVTRVLTTREHATGVMRSQERLHETDEAYLTIPTAARPLQSAVITSTTATFSIVDPVPFGTTLARRDMETKLSAHQSAERERALAIRKQQEEVERAAMQVVADKATETALAAAAAKGDAVAQAALDTLRVLMANPSPPAVIPIPAIPAIAPLAPQHLTTLPGTPAATAASAAAATDTSSTAAAAAAVAAETAPTLLLRSSEGLDHLDFEFVLQKLLSFVVDQPEVHSLFSSTLSEFFRKVFQHFVTLDQARREAAALAEQKNALLVSTRDIERELRLMQKKHAAMELTIATQSGQILRRTAELTAAREKYYAHLLLIREIVQNHGIHPDLLVDFNSADITSQDSRAANAERTRAELLENYNKIATVMDHRTNALLTSLRTGIFSMMQALQKKLDRCNSKIRTLDVYLSKARYKSRKQIHVFDLLLRGELTQEKQAEIRARHALDEAAAEAERLSRMQNDEVQAAEEAAKASAAAAAAAAAAGSSHRSRREESNWPELEETHPMGYAMLVQLRARHEAQWERMERQARDGDLELMDEEDQRDHLETVLRDQGQGSMITDRASHQADTNRSGADTGGDESNPTSPKGHRRNKSSTSRPGTGRAKSRGSSISISAKGSRRTTSISGVPTGTSTGMTPTQSVATLLEKEEKKSAAAAAVRKAKKGLSALGSDTPLTSGRKPSTPGSTRGGSSMLDSLTAMLADGIDADGGSGGGGADGTESVGGGSSSAGRSRSYSIDDSGSTPADPDGLPDDPKTRGIAQRWTEVESEAFEREAARGTAKKPRRPSTKPTPSAKSGGGKASKSKTSTGSSPQSDGRDLSSPAGAADDEDDPPLSPDDDDDEPEGRRVSSDEGEEEAGGDGSAFGSRPSSRQAGRSRGSLLKPDGGEKVMYATGLTAANSPRSGRASSRSAASGAGGGGSALSTARSLHLQQQRSALAGEIGAIDAELNASQSTYSLLERKNREILDKIRALDEERKMVLSASPSVSAGTRDPSAANSSLGSVDSTRRSSLAASSSHMAQQPSPRGSDSGSDGKSPAHKQSHARGGRGATGSRAGGSISSSAALDGADTASLISGDDNASSSAQPENASMLDPDLDIDDGLSERERAQRKEDRSLRIQQSTQIERQKKELERERRRVNKENARLDAKLKLLEGKKREMRSQMENLDRAASDPDAAAAAAAPTSTSVQEHSNIFHRVVMRSVGLQVGVPFTYTQMPRDLELAAQLATMAAANAGMEALKPTSPRKAAAGDEAKEADQLSGSNFAAPASGTAAASAAPGAYPHPLMLQMQALGVDPLTIQTYIQNQYLLQQQRARTHPHSASSAAAPGADDASNRSWSFYNQAYPDAYYTAKSFLEGGADPAAALKVEPVPVTAATGSRSARGGAGGARPPASPAAPQSQLGVISSSLSLSESQREVLFKAELARRRALEKSLSVFARLQARGVTSEEASKHLRSVMQRERSAEMERVLRDLELLKGSGSASSLPPPPPSSSYYPAERDRSPPASSPNSRPPSSFAQFYPPAAPANAATGPLRPSSRASVGGGSSRPSTAKSMCSPFAGADGDEDYAQGWSNDGSRVGGGAVASGLARGLVSSSGRPISAASSTSSSGYAYPHVIPSTTQGMHSSAHFATAAPRAATSTQANSERRTQLMQQQQLQAAGARR